MFPFMFISLLHLPTSGDEDSFDTYFSKNFMGWNLVTEMYQSAKFGVCKDFLGIYIDMFI